ncbi:MAG: c-type cytochrome, partial [Candidatus Acidiferrales bacterium]
KVARRLAMAHFETRGGMTFQIGILISTVLFFGLGNMAFAQDNQVKKEPIKQTAPLSGAGMFKDYCAVCHGKDAKGNGPAASALKRAPANLTTLAKRHEGEFPDLYVEEVLRNGVTEPAHGDAEMPVWGPLFRSMDSDPAIMDVRIMSLVSYIKSLQVK